MTLIKGDVRLKAWVLPQDGLNGWDRGQNSNLLDMVMLHIELKEMMHAAT